MKALKYYMAVLGILVSGAATAQPKKSAQWICGPTYVLHLGSFKILTDPMFSPKGDSAFIIAKHPTTTEMDILLSTKKVSIFTVFTGREILYGLTKLQTIPNTGISTC